MAQSKKKYMKQYRLENKEKIKAYHKKYYSRPEIKKKVIKYHKEYDQMPENKKRHKIQQKMYSKLPRRRERINKYNKNKYHTDIEYRIGKNMKSAIWNALKTKGTSKNGNSWSKLVGYTKKELKEHLESLFKLGMSWENRSEWHIDHIIPQKLFNYTSYSDPKFRECWALSNLQPLWAEENLNKGSRVL